MPKREIGLDFLERKRNIEESLKEMLKEGDPEPFIFQFLGGAGYRTQIIGWTLVDGRAIGLPVNMTRRRTQFVDELFRGFAREMRRRDRRTRAARARRENAGPREGIDDFWRLCKAGKQLREGNS